MKNQNNKVTAVLFVVALALAPMVQAMPERELGPVEPLTDMQKALKPLEKFTGVQPFEIIVQSAHSLNVSLVKAPQCTPVNLAADDGTGENSEAKGGALTTNLPMATTIAPIKP